MEYPGQRVQVDVKIVSAVRITDDAKDSDEHFVQCTTIDEYSRFRISPLSGNIIRILPCSSYLPVKAFSFKMECLQCITETTTISLCALYTSVLPSNTYLTISKMACFTDFLSPMFDKPTFAPHLSFAKLLTFSGFWRILLLSHR